MENYIDSITNNYADRRDGNQRYVVGMAYVVDQVLNEVYSTENGFRYGTIFPDLHKPFIAGGCNI